MRYARAMKLRLLKFAARRPLLALALSCCVVGMSIAAIAGLATSRGRTSEAPNLADGAPTPSGNPRAILSRVWFDKYPEKRTDTIEILIFLAGGIGIHEKGSAWRATVDVFEFERQG